jgi:serine/threonine protein kinase
MIVVRPSTQNDIDDCYSPAYGNIVDRVKRLLGEGTYGKVVECYDKKRERYVAVKIIRNLEKYREAAKIEIRILDNLYVHDPQNQK